MQGDLGNPRLQQVEISPAVGPPLSRHGARASKSKSLCRELFICCIPCCVPRSQLLERLQISKLAALQHPRLSNKRTPRRSSIWPVQPPGCGQDGLPGHRWDEGTRRRSLRTARTSRRAAGAAAQAKASGCGKRRRFPLNVGLAERDDRQNVSLCTCIRSRPLASAQEHDPSCWSLHLPLPSSKTACSPTMPGTLQPRWTILKTRTTCPMTMKRRAAAGVRCGSGPAAAAHWAAMMSPGLHRSGAAGGPLQRSPRPSRQVGAGWIHVL